MNKLENYGLKGGGFVATELIYEQPFCVYNGCYLGSVIGGGYSYINFNSRVFATKIGRYSSIAHGVLIGLARHEPKWALMSHLSHFEGINSAGLNPASKDALPLNEASPATTTLGNGVWIGANAIIPGARELKMGNGSVLAAGSVLTKDAPPYSIMAGNPAKVVKMRFSDEICADLDDSKWWEYDFNLAAAYIPELTKILDIKNPSAFIDFLKSGELEAYKFQSKWRKISLQGQKANIVELN